MRLWFGRRVMKKTRLHVLGLDSLELRRLRFDLINAYKLLFGLVDQSPNIFFTLTRDVHNISTRGHNYKLYPANSRIDAHKFFFLSSCG